MRLRTFATAVTAVATGTAVALAPAALAEGRASGPDAVALADRGHDLLALTTGEPGDTPGIGTLRGYAPGDTLLVGIDHHPRTGALLGVGDGGGIYRVDAGTAELTRIGALTVPLDGRFFGVDVDPAANALRIVSDTGQNLRHPFTAGSDVPGPVSTAGPALDRQGVSGIAHTGDGTLYGIDTVADQLVAVDPADGSTTGVGEPGLLGDLAGSAGFDVRISSPGRRGLAAVLRSGVPTLLAVDLTDGTATRAGRFGTGVVDLALLPDTPPAEGSTP